MWPQKQQNETRSKVDTSTDMGKQMHSTECVDIDVGVHNRMYDEADRKGKFAVVALFELVS